VSQTQQLKIYRVFGKSDKGLVRKENQDAFSYFESINGSVFVLCDGMGGIPGGKKAAKKTIKNIENFISEDWYDDEKVLIKDALNFANKELRKEFGQPETGIYPGTTIVLVIIRDNRVFFAHAGDSRIYYQTGKKLFQLTEDHSLIVKLLREKKLNKAEAENYPNKNIIYNAVGIKDEIFIKINKKSIFPADNDIILLCSDGLTNELNDKRISEILKKDTDIKKKGNLLIQNALNSGGTDNVTVLLIQFYNTGKKTSKNYKQNTEQKRKHLIRIALIIFIFLLINAIFMLNYFINLPINKIIKPNNKVISYDLILKINNKKEFETYSVGKCIYSYPDVAANSIIDILTVNNKKAFYFYPGERIKNIKKEKY